MLSSLKNNNKKNNIVFSVLIIANILLVLFISQFVFFRIDATKEKVYSLTDYTKKIIKDIPDRINITYYFSPILESRFPGILTISGVLDEYAQIARDKVSLIRKNPANLSNEKEALAAGLIPQQFQSYDSTDVIYHTVYSGITIEYQGKQIVIPIILSSDNLEFQVTTAILALIYPTKKTIGIIDGTNKFNVDYSYFKEWLSQIRYNLLELTEEYFLQNNFFADDFSVLFIIGDENLSLSQMDFIEKWAKDNKPLFFASSPCTIDLAHNWEATQKTKRALFEMLLQNNGLRTDSSFVLDNANVRLAMQNEKYQTYDYLNYPFWPIILKQNLNSANKITSNISSLSFYWPGAIYIDDFSNIEVLAKTGASSWKIEEHSNTNPFSEHKTTDVISSYNIAVASKKNNARSIFVADEYFFSNAIEWSNSVENLDFIASAILWLAGEDDVLSLQKKVSNPSKLNFAGTIEEQKNTVFLMWFLPVVIFPLFLFIVSVYIHIKRKGV